MIKKVKLHILRGIYSKIYALHANIILSANFTKMYLNFLTGTHFSPSGIFQKMKIHKLCDLFSHMR